ncbi:MAG TPA: hypothetical protein VIQ27_11470 [Gemmatimonadales bacterium]
MRHSRPLLLRLARVLVPTLAGGAAAVGCALPTYSTRLADGPDPVDLRMDTPVLRNGQQSIVVVQSPSADSIALVSASGLDRYWSHGSRLFARVSGDFGDSGPGRQYAVWHDGVLLDRLMKPATISVCREGHCREFYHEFEVRLPERNERTVAVSAGWNTVFASRTFKDVSRGPLSRKALSSGAFFVEGELALTGWSVRAQGVYGRDGQAAALDLSRVLKPGGEVSYGIALHVGGLRNEWLPDGRRPALANRMAYNLGIGPSIMMRGITASTQFGVLTNGHEALQVLSTRVSANGRLTSVRIPVSISAEKTFAFGGGPIVSRRSDALERLSASVHLLESLALNFGVSSHRITWPGERPSLDFRASEVLMTVGARYMLTW